MKNDKDSVTMRKDQEKEDQKGDLRIIILMTSST